MNVKSIVFVSLALTFLLFMIGCTDRDVAKLRAYGGSAKIKCYSGAKLIYDGESTGKVSSEQKSDGFSFVDKKTGKLVEVSGNCVITYLDY